MVVVEELEGLQAEWEAAATKLADVDRGT
jgi:hypothetical protein